MLLIILNLIEIETKQVLLRYGIPIPKGILISDSKQTVPALSNLKPPYIVKAQVPVSGRGKAGGTQEKKKNPSATNNFFSFNLGSNFFCLITSSVFAIMREISSTLFAVSYQVPKSAFLIVQQATYLW